MRIVAVAVNAVVLAVWGTLMLRMTSRRVAELVHRQRELLARVRALHRATELGLASIHRTLRELARPRPDGSGVAMVGGRSHPGRARCSHRAGLRLWATDRARRSPRRPDRPGRARGRPPRLRP